MNAPQLLHRSSAMGSTVGHPQQLSWATCLLLWWHIKLMMMVVVVVFFVSSLR